MPQWGLALIGTAKLNDVAPQAWLADVLDRIAKQLQTRLRSCSPGTGRSNDSRHSPRSRHSTFETDWAASAGKTIRMERGLHRMLTMGSRPSRIHQCDGPIEADCEHVLVVGQRHVFRAVFEPRAVESDPRQDRLAGIGMHADGAWHGERRARHVLRDLARLHACGHGAARRAPVRVVLAELDVTAVAVPA